MQVQSICTWHSFIITSYLFHSMAIRVQGNFPFGYQEIKKIKELLPEYNACQNVIGESETLLLEEALNPDNNHAA